MKGIVDQVSAAREFKLEDVIKEKDTITDILKKFYLSFCGNNGLVGWESVFKEDLYKYISYYRIDSALLADRILLGYPTLTIIHPNRIEDYYGIGFSELESLIKANLVFPIALHPSKYTKIEPKQFLEKLENDLKSNSQHPILPLYADSFNDSMASYWLSNIGGEKNTFKEWRENAEKDFSFFLNLYHEYLKERDEKFKLLDLLPQERVVLHSSLEYGNLRNDAKERILKLKLFAEVLKSFENKEGYLIERRVELLIKELEEMLKNNNLEQIAKKVFSTWQFLGAPWDYSRGGIVEFSLRDLTLNPSPPKVEVKTTENLEGINAIELKLDMFPRFVFETNIDDRNSIAQRVRERSNFIRTLFKDKDFKEWIKPNVFFELRKEVSSGKFNKWEDYQDILKNAIQKVANDQRNRYGRISLSVGILALLVAFIEQSISLAFNIISILSGYRALKPPILRKFCMEKLEVGLTSCHDISNEFSRGSSDEISNISNAQLFHLPYARRDETYSNTRPFKFWVRR